MSVVIDADQDEYGTGTEMTMQKMSVVSTTPKGVWLKSYPFVTERHFVLGTASKQFAAPTKELALMDLLQVKKRHLSILEAQAGTVKEMIRKVEHQLNWERRKNGQDISEENHSRFSTV